MSTLIAVGERIYDRTLSVEQVAAARAEWDAVPLGSILWYPALYEGAGRTRLLRYLGVEPELCVNLLPPDRRIGTWEPAAARGNAFRLAKAVPYHFEAPRLFLLGRRVIDAFSDPGCRYAFGTILHADGVPALCLPHPSGRSRYFNAEGKREEVRRWVDTFRRCFCS